MATSRTEKIRTVLNTAFQPQQLEINDRSSLHAGHAGARDGMGHFHVRIVAARFSGRDLLERHRMVYAAMGELMQTDVHALAIDALSPDEIVPQ